MNNLTSEPPSSTIPCLLISHIMHALCILKKLVNIWLYLIMQRNCEVPNLSNWFNANFLSLNPNKSNYIVFTGSRNKLPEDLNKSIILNNIAIKWVSNVKFLGVIIDEHLTWKYHINLAKNKAAKMIGIIKRLKSTLPLSASRISYHAFVLPCLNYGVILWGEAIKLHYSLSTYFRRKLSD